MRPLLQRYVSMMLWLCSCTAALPAIAQIQSTVAVNDTTREDEVKENAVIEDIIAQGNPPAPDKVEYINQQTKYGFRNLFTSFGYNAALPYSMQVNPKAEWFMQDYLRNHGNRLTKMKTWAMPYFNLIDHILAQYGLPRELKYLAVIESDLKTSATSWVGAAGPWQFMPQTAREHGLMVNNLADERRDYFKSTHAAARYLLELYRQMHDWLLVIAAYNGGPGRVYDAIRKSGSRNFWSLQYYLPEESRNHVKKFIATHYVMEAMSANGFTSGNFYAPAGSNKPLDNHPALSEVEMAQTDKQTISGKYMAQVIAKNLSMPLDSFHRFNPEFDSRLAANGQYDLLLPTDKMQQFLSSKYQILNESVQLMLGNDEVPGTKTNYPSPSPIRKKKKSRG